IWPRETYALVKLFTSLDPGWRASGVQNPAVVLDPSPKASRAANAGWQLGPALAFARHRDRRSAPSLHSIGDMLWVTSSAPASSSLPWPWALPPRRRGR